ncbi:MAG: hypothetical protein WAL56_11045 [Candidatus Sulfotelmatobacter sp.]
MNRVAKMRKTINLSQSLRKKLEMYGLAAGTAGVVAAALGSTAQAEIVYTPAHKEVTRGGLNLSLTNDGIVNFTLHYRFFGYADSGGMLVYSRGSNRVLGSSQRGLFASNLAAGYQVGANGARFEPGATFSSFFGPAKLMYNCFGLSVPSCGGPWDKNTANGYLGFKFLIKGEVHYGWARLTVTVKNIDQFHVYLTGYAYETIPNQPIETGKTSGTDERSAVGAPGTLGRLAGGRPTF